MLAEVVKIEQVIREVPEGGMAWNLLCEVVNTLLENNHKEDEHHEHQKNNHLHISFSTVVSGDCLLHDGRRTHKRGR